MSGTVECDRSGRPGQAGQVQLADASFRRIFEQTPVAMLLVRHGPGPPRIMRANPAAADLFGTSVEALTAPDPTAAPLFEPRDLSPDASPDASPDDRRPRVRAYRRGDGTRFRAELHVDPIRLPGLDEALALVQVTEIPARRADERRRSAERTLIERAAREQRERLEQEFVTNASHELRTPVTAILAAVEALESGAVDDPRQRARFLTHLRRESTRLGRLSDSLLLLAQAQSLGALPVEPIAVVDLLTRITAELSVAGDVAVSLDVDPSLTLRANPGLMEIVVGNLASNAARFTAVGAVRMTAWAHLGGVVVEVRDSGPGMDSSTLERARDRFYRNPVTRDRTGFGLGLSIAARAASAMGATLDLTSSPGRGTCGRLICPAAPPPPRGR